MPLFFFDALQLLSFHFRMQLDPQFYRQRDIFLFYQVQPIFPLQILHLLRILLFLFWLFLLVLHPHRLNLLYRQFLVFYFYYFYWDHHYYQNHYHYRNLHCHHPNRYWNHRKNHFHHQNHYLDFHCLQVQLRLVRLLLVTLQDQFHQIYTDLQYHHLHKYEYLFYLARYLPTLTN